MKMTSRIYHLLILLGMIFLFSSCSFFQTAKDHDSPKYFTGENLEEMSSDELKIRITKVGFMAGGQYEYTITPITQPFLQRRANELGLERGLTQDEVKMIIAKDQEKYLQQKVCIEFGISIVRFQTVSKIKEWKVAIVDKAGFSYPIKWDRKSLRKRPIVELFPGLYGPEQKWLNFAQGCADITFALSEGFRIRVNPSYVQWPFDNSSELTWNLTAKEAGTFQSYRGF